MKHRERGAISAVWFVLVIVLFLAAMGVTYSLSQELKRAEVQLATAEREKNSFSDELATEKEKHQKLSGLVGFRVEGATYSAPESITAKVDEVRNRYPNDIGASDTSLEDMVTKLLGLATSFEQTRNDAIQRADAEVAARTAADQAHQSAAAALQAQLDQLNRDLGDSRNLLTQQQSAADARAAELQRQIDDATLQRNEAESAHSKSLASEKQETDKAKARVADLAEKVRIQGTDENPWAPDGKILSVGENTGLVFIDIGSRQLLRAGVKFDVFRYGKGGELVRKGAIEVRETNPDDSTAGVLTELSDFDPIVAGDVIANPHFAKNHSKVFVLLGNFPAYGTDFLAQRLRDLGCEVETSVTSHTDFLVLGEKGGEEDAAELTDDPGYRLATATGVQIMKLADIERFIRP
jgi:BRCA1 C Terminus (BRCT) domain